MENIIVDDKYKWYPQWSCRLECHFKRGTLDTLQMIKYVSDLPQVGNIYTGLIVWRYYRYQYVLMTHLAQCQISCFLLFFPFLWRVSNIKIISFWVIWSHTQCVGVRFVWPFTYNPLLFHALQKTHFLSKLWYFVFRLQSESMNDHSLTPTDQCFSCIRVKPFKHNEVVNQYIVSTFFFKEKFAI